MRVAITSFTVEGRGEFPADMLRYDQCWPADADAVSAIRAPYLDRRVQIRLNSITAVGPTSQRWDSFGWKVIHQAWRIGELS